MSFVSNQPQRHHGWRPKNIKAYVLFIVWTPNPFKILALDKQELNLANKIAASIVYQKTKFLILHGIGKVQGDQISSKKYNTNYVRQRTKSIV